MKDTIITIAVAIIGSGVLNTVIAQLFEIHNKKKDAKSGMNAGVRLILKDRLRYLCTHYIEQGWIYADELEDIIAMHECYHTALNGNGYLDAMMEQVKKLKIKGVGM